MFVATDIGGTNGRVRVYESLVSTEPLGGADFKVVNDFWVDYSRLQSVIEALASEYGRVMGIGLSLAGKVNSDRSELVFAGNITDWVGQPVAGLLARRFRCKVVIGNDAEALALAEAVYGLCSRPPFDGVPFMGAILGSGFGGAWVYYQKDGSYLTVPGEPGHIQISQSRDAKCGCGEYGHLEAYVGGANVPARFNGKKAEQLNNVEWKHFLASLETGMRSLLRVHPVPLVVFSGGIACNKPWLLRELEWRFDEPKFGSPKFRVSAFGEGAGSLGALSLLRL